MAFLEVIPYKKEYKPLLELYPLIKANKVLPFWYKDLRRGNLKELNDTLHSEEIKTLTAKQCPAIQDIISTGFIIPLWTRIDFSTNFTEEETTYNYNIHFLNSRVLNEDVGEHLSFHTSDQVDGMNLKLTPDNKILKLFCPYYFKVPEGYSLLYSDPFYHFRKDIRCLPGIVQADKWGSITFPFEILKDNFTINAGTPLIHIFPYKRNDELDLLINEGTEQDFYNIKKNNLKYFSSRVNYKDL